MSILSHKAIGALALRMVREAGGELGQAELVALLEEHGVEADRGRAAIGIEVNRARLVRIVERDGAKRLRLPSGDWRVAA